ncbi:MAG: peptide MFS transporter [Thermoanaerobaculia bacterium]
MTKDPTSELANEPATTVVDDFEPAGRPPAEHAFFGHPRGLATLFFTEFWERFSYYGMRGLLFLFMVTAAAEGGLGFSEGRAGAVYGLYVAGVYLLALPGGWLADRLFGQQRAIFIGGCIIAAGHFSMAIPTLGTFYLGLVLIVMGTGLLKPNISAIVGELYPEGGARRDAGFSIFYMGINLGAFVAPLVCGALGEKVDWHLGFGAAGVGMVFGLIQYAYGKKYLGEAGLLQPSGLAGVEEERRKRRIYAILGGGFVAVVALAGGARLLGISIEDVANGALVLILSAAILFFGYVLLAGGLDGTEKKRVGAFAILFLFSVLFWMGFEQAGGSMNVFALELTDRDVFGWQMPASWLQSVNPLFIILLAPVFGALWVALSKRSLNPSIPLKFAAGLVLLGLGFFALVYGARAAEAGVLVSPWWLILAYLLHTSGELCLSPVGLSMTTKLAPKRFASQMMGVWFLSLSLGNLSAGIVSGQIETLPMADLFFWVFAVTAGGGALLLLLSRPVNRLTGGIK